MTRLSRFLMAPLLAVVVAPTPALAQDTPAKGVSWDVQVSSPPNALAKRVSLDIKAMTPADTFKVLADSIGLTVTVDPSLITPVDLVVRSVQAKTALDTICDSIGCVWRLTGGAITVTPLGVGPGRARNKSASIALLTRNKQDVERLRIAFKQPLPADMKFDNAPLAEVAARLSTATGLHISIEAGPEQGQTVSADLSHRSLSSALSVLSEQMKGTLVCSLAVARGDAGEPKLQIHFKIRVAQPMKKR